MVVIRLLVTVLLAVALLAAAVPLVQDARQQTAETAGERSMSRIRGVIGELTARSDPTAKSPGAGRTLTLLVPQASPGSVGLDWIAIGGVPGRPGPEEPPGTDIIAFSVDGTVHVNRLSSVEVRVRMDDHRLRNEVPLVLRGARTVRFTYRIGEDGPVIVVRAQDS